MGAVDAVDGQRDEERRGGDGGRARAGEAGDGGGGEGGGADVEAGEGECGEGVIVVDVCMRVSACKMCCV